MLADVADIVAETLGDTYPELKSNFPFIKRTLEFEENNFARTLEFGTAVLGSMIRYRADNAAKVERLVDTMERESGDGSSRSDLNSLEFSAGSGQDAASVGSTAAIDAANSRIAVFQSAIQNASGAGEQAGPIAAAKDSLLNWSREITGREAFRLYDTYGFPLEVTTELLAERDMVVDQAGFDAEMDRQRQRARAASAGFSGDAEQRRIYEQLGVDHTEFLGYEGTTAESVVIGMIKDGALIESASEGEDVEVVLRKTPFYAEKGGQIGDTGHLMSGNAQVTVTDTQSPYARLSVHNAHIDEGELRVGDTVTAAVDYERREQIRRNHTATHLVHAALREIIGPHVRQSGSLVAPDRLRFDFTHMSPLTKERNQGGARPGQRENPVKRRRPHPPHYLQQGHRRRGIGLLWRHVRQRSSHGTDRSSLEFRAVRGNPHGPYGWHRRLHDHVRVRQLGQVSAEWKLSPGSAPSRRYRSSLTFWIACQLPSAHRLTNL